MVLSIFMVVFIAAKIFQSKFVRSAKKFCIKAIHEIFMRFTIMVI